MRNTLEIPKINRNGERTHMWDFTSQNNRRTFPNHQQKAETSYDEKGRRLCVCVDGWRRVERGCK